MRIGCQLHLTHAMLFCSLHCIIPSSEKANLYSCALGSSTAPRVVVRLDFWVLGQLPRPSHGRDHQVQCSSGGLDKQYDAAAQGRGRDEDPTDESLEARS